MTTLFVVVTQQNKTLFGTVVSNQSLYYTIILINLSVYSNRMYLL